MNYEYCTALNHRNKVYKEVELNLSPSQEERYISMFGFDNSIYEHLEIAKTVQGFKGNYFCKWVYFDLDSENLEESHQMAKDFTTLLYNMLGINPKTLFISFSGNKGFHIGLPQSLFGGFQPSKDLPDRIKVLAVKILSECFEKTLEEIQAEVSKAKKQIFNLMDLSIYSPNRIFRQLNSKNAKSGLYKIGLTFDQLHTLTLAEIKELAINPVAYAFEVNPSQVKPLEELVGLWQYALSFDIGGYNHQQRPRENAGGEFFYAPEEGSRNNDLFKQAAMLFDKSEFSERQVIQLVGLINNASSRPLPLDEVETIVKSAFKKTLPNRAIKVDPKKEVENFTDWLEEWADYYTTEKKPFTLLFDKIDQDQENNFTGKLVNLIGAGGTRKSYLALNILAKNILLHEARGMYSSMEMGKVELVNRALDIVFPPEDGVPASKIARKNIKLDKNGYLPILKEAVKTLHDKLILSNVSNKTAQDYYQDYRKAVELYGPVDFLIVDGLSMMGGTGSENERFEKHTKELKALANATGLFIILICHTTKEAKPHTRDASPFVRGSGKILDNCDFMISCANIINEMTSTPDNVEYERLFAHLKYYNKRGTGLMLNLMYDFDPLTKEVLPCHKDPRHFKEYDAFVKEYNSKQRKSSKQDEPF